MTVIAWDGKTLAADKLANSNGLIYRVTKIKKIRGHLVGASGDFSPIQAMFKWFEDGADVKEMPKCQDDKDRWTALLVINPKGKIFRYEQDGYPWEIEEKRHAVGCGRDFALAVMEMGGDAIKAVKIASKLDANCGLGVDTLRFG